MAHASGTSSWARQPYDPGLAGDVRREFGRERGTVARYTELFAATIAAETGASRDGVEPVAVATALMGVHRALVAFVRKQVLGGRQGTRLAEDFRSQAVNAFALLEKGLAGYASRQAETDVQDRNVRALAKTQGNGFAQPRKTSPPRGAASVRG